MYVTVRSKQFDKSLKKVSQLKNFNEEALLYVVGQLENNTPLSARYRDHELKGEFAGIRECHIKDNILLMYRKEKDILVLLLVDIGTHPSLFK